MEIDIALQKNVERAIKWEPLLKSTRLGVDVNNGVVTLTGVVDRYSKITEAISAAKSVIGVKGIVPKIEVDLGGAEKISDGEIAEDAIVTLKNNWQLSSDEISAQVDRGWITLSGEVNWNYQREAATDAVASLAGVRGITNNTSIKQESKNIIEAVEIENALAHNGAVNNSNIMVVVAGCKVVLSGTVTSWYQKEQAEKIAWKAPGVWTVENNLVIEFEPEMVVGTR